MLVSYLNPDVECRPAASQTELQHPDVSHPPGPQQTGTEQDSVKGKVLLFVNVVDSSKILN